jgi:hypothetical protein
MFGTRNTVFRNVGVPGTNQMADLGQCVFPSSGNSVISCIDAS